MVMLSRRHAHQRLDEASLRTWQMADAKLSQRNAYQRVNEAPPSPVQMCQMVDVMLSRRDARQRADEASIRT